MNCPYKYIHEKDLYSVVYELINLEIQKYADIDRVIAKLSQESGHKSRLAKYDAEIEDAERELRRIASLRQAVYDDYAAKLLTVSEYQYATGKYDGDFDKQTVRLEAAKREKKEFTQKGESINKWLAAFKQFKDEKKLTEEMAHILIKRIEVSDRDRVSVTFNFRDEFEAISAVLNGSPDSMAVAI